MAVERTGEYLEDIGSPAPEHRLKLTRIEYRRNGDVARLHMDEPDGLTLDVAVDVVVSHGLAAGDQLSGEDLAALRREAELSRARDSALTLLAHRPRTRDELRRRLRRKELEGGVIEEVLAWLEDRHLVDDREFAEAFVRDRLKLKPRGRFGLAQELRARGVDDGVAEAAIDAVLSAEAIDEGELAREVAAVWERKNRAALRRADDRGRRSRERRRLYGHLARRGFSSDAIRTAMDDVLDD